MRIRGYLAIIVTVIVSIITIFSFTKEFIPSLNNQGWVGVFFLGCLTLLFLGYSVYLVLIYGKKAYYSSYFVELNWGYSKLNMIDRQDTNSENFIVEVLIDVCTSISIFFTKLNKHHIGTCIKILEEDNGKLKVKTLARDNKSSIKGRKSGDADKVDHWIEDNSDFNFIYSNFENDNIDTSHYFGRRLPQKRDYKNTRLNEWPPKKINFFLIDNIIRQQKWPLSYRSTVVVPIVPLGANEQTKSAIRGFLCIDSPKNKTFYKQLDVDILKGICDNIYNKIDILYKILNS